MNIGILNFEISPAGLSQLVEKIVAQLGNVHTIKSIKLESNKDVFQYADFGLENSGETILPPKKLISASPLRMDTSIYQSLKQFDAVIVTGPGEALPLIEKLEKELSHTSFLFIPVSIYNDIEGSELSLGYDTGVNFIVESILKIRDTIDSLKYPNPRLFGVQLTGRASANLLEEVGAATESHVIYSDWKNFEAKELNASLKEEFSTGKTHSFVIFDVTVQAEKIPGIILPSLPISWNYNQIEEALCMGPNPTALDRIISMKFARKTVEWIEEKKPTGKLLIVNREAIFSEL